MKGVYTALVTPFAADESLDVDALKGLLQRQIDAGVDGICLLGTTGEGATLDEQERRQVITTARAHSRAHLMVGCGTNSTRSTVANALMAQELGADSLLVVTPYYNRPTQEGIFCHFEAVAKAVSLPICIYNIPSRTGQNIEPATLARLAVLPHIAAIKEAAGSIAQIQELLATVPTPVLSGDDGMMLPLMALGGHGVVSVISNLVPEMVVQLYQAMMAHDLPRARELHYRLKPLVHAAFLETNPAPIKRLLELAGCCSSRCRLPLVGVQPHTDTLLKATYEAQ